MKIHKCKICQSEKKGTSNIVFIVNDMMIYEEYCLDCAKKFFREKKVIDSGFMNIRDIKACAELYSMNLQQQIMNNPKKMENILQSKPYKDIFEKMFGKEEAKKFMDKRVLELSQKEG